MYVSCPPPNTNADRTDATTDISIWSNIEAGLGITAGSLVTLKPLLKLFREETRAGTRTRSRTTGHTTENSQSERLATKYWRPDLDADDTQAVITTVQTTQLESGSSSEEDLNSMRHGANGVNVQKTFYVTADEKQ